MQWLSSRLQERLGTMLTIDNGHGRKRIERVGNDFFSKKYALGDVMFTSVHRAMEIRSGCRLCDNLEVVIKVRYKPDCLFDCREEHEWRNSMELMLNLPSNSGVAQILEVLEDDKKICVIIERAVGMDLHDLLKTDIPLSVPASCEILAQLLEAVAHLHENGVIHRDLKLENVVMKPPSEMKCDNGFTPCVPQALKLIDFDTVQEWKPDTPPSMTLHGTDQYIPQEGYGGRYSPLSDIFSIGVIGYRLVVGHFPFRQELFDVNGPLSVHDLSRKIQYRLRATKVPWDVPVLQENPSLRDLLKRMMAPKTEQRPNAQEALQHELFASRIATQSSQEASLPNLRSSHVGLSKCHGHELGLDRYPRGMVVC
jgi:serine/threonine protein kinase